MKNIRFFFALLLSGLSLSSNAQISFGGVPSSSMRTRSLHASDVIPCIDIIPDTSGYIEVNQFAYPTNTDIDIVKESASSIIENNIIYRLLIKSENAKSINLIFSPIHLPDGAKMFLYRPDMGEIYGAYTNGSFAGDVFATTPVTGDSIMIQCEVPIANSDSFYATISSVNIGFEALRLLPSLNRSLVCETNAVCENTGLEDQCRSTCLITINGNRYCSGTLVATEGNDSETFVLTSAHCLRDASNIYDANLASKCVFYFGYSAPICGAQIEGTYEKSISGSQVASSNTEKDMLLLKLSNRPPVDFMTYKSGWNIELAPHSPVSCLHHPNGDLLKINISSHDPSPATFDYEGFAKNNHWFIDEWNVGLTEKGSSGAPLYDSNGLIIGALSGGYSDCGYRGGDYFWRLNNVWDDNSSKPTSIMSVLDSSLSGIIKIPGRETTENRCYPLKNFYSSSEVNEAYANEYGYASGYNHFGLEEFAEKFTSPYTSTEIHGVSFIPIVGTYNVENPVYLRIYSGDDKPEDLVYESAVKITAKEFKSKPNGFINNILSNWSYKENYIRLDSVVTVGKTFFVSLYTDYENVKFALLSTSSDKKTAYFKKNGVWESWKNHPFDNSVGSLLINTVVRDKNISKIKDFSIDGEISVYPNPAKEIVHFRCPDKIMSIRVFNVEGAQILYTEEASLIVKDLANGIYPVEITTHKGKYHVKFIKE